MRLVLAFLSCSPMFPRLDIFKSCYYDQPAHLALNRSNDWKIFIYVGINLTTRLVLTLTCRCRFLAFPTRLPIRFHYTSGSAPFALSHRGARVCSLCCAWLLVQSLPWASQGCCQSVASAFEAGMVALAKTSLGTRREVIHQTFFNMKMRS